MSNVITVCTGHYSETGISDCTFGCKIYKCEDCGHEKVIHNRTYGCPKSS